MANGARRFNFRIALDGRIDVEAADGAGARTLVVRALDGVEATLASGSGSGIAVTDLRLTSAVLLTVDGVDPTEALERRLRDYRAGGRRDEDDPPEAQ